MTIGNRLDLVHLPLSAMIAFWSLLIVVFCGWNISNDYSVEYDNAVTVAASNFDKDMAFRRWAARQQGVYVQQGPEAPGQGETVTPPGQILTTTSGSHLTLLATSFMTRAIHEQSSSPNGIRGHLTSLKPIREQNAPDPWERQTLQLFERGTKEHHALATFDGDSYLRFMRPLETEESCLPCHGQQGYKVGDVRGGLSISVPWQPHKERLQQHIVLTIAGHGIVWLVGMLVMKSVDSCSCM